MNSGTQIPLLSRSMDVPSPAPTEPWGDDEEIEWEDIDRVEPFVDDERKWMER